jgi:type IV secretion system protein VirB5
MNKAIRFLMLSLSLIGMGGNAYAGLPVYDGAALSNSISSWAAQAQSMANQLGELKKQYDTMQQQYQQLQQTYNSISGIRNMGDIVNNPALRKYLPPDYQQVLKLGTGVTSGNYGTLDGAVNGMKQATKILDIGDTGLDPNSPAGKSYQNAQTQAAVNRVLAEESFRQSGARIDDLQQLLNKVNNAPDDKDIQDLQARIQAEQVMLQNEQIRLASLAQLAQSQRDISTQQATEIIMQTGKGEIPRF